MAYEQDTVKALRDIADSLRILAGRTKKPEGFSDGPQRLSEPLSTPEGDWEAYQAYARPVAASGGWPQPYSVWRTERIADTASKFGMDVSPRLAEKLLNPEGH